MSSFKLKYFSKNTPNADYLQGSCGMDVGNSFHKDDFPGIYKWLDTMIKQSPRYKNILDYIKNKTKPGKVVLDK